MVPIRNFVASLPWLPFALLIGVAATALSGFRLGLTCILRIASLAVFCLWTRAMLSLCLVTLALFVGLEIGLPLGVMAGLNRRAYMIVDICSDINQSLPTFVYLVTVLALFGAGDFPAQIGSGSTNTATCTSKFGYPLKDGNNRDILLSHSAERPWLNSIHMPTGSQRCPLELIAKGVAEAVNFAEEVNDAGTQQQVIHVDISGGLPVNLSSDEVTPTFREYADLLRSAVPVLFTAKYKAKTEFGRSISAKNGFLVTRVEYTKECGSFRGDHPSGCSDFHQNGTLTKVVANPCARLCLGGTG